MFLKKNTQLLVLLSITFFVFFSCNQSVYETIKTDFEKPKEDNTVWCYWYWINSDISKEGITKDLEAMKKAGIGGALIGNINPGNRNGKLLMLSDDWWSHMVHAVTEGKRIGVDIGIFNCAGWSQSGGPWVDSTKAMRYLTYSETNIEGGKEVKIKLKQPKKEFQDTHTLAFKSSDIERKSTQFIPTKVTANWKDIDAETLIDGIINDSKFIPQKNNPLEIRFSLNEKITARHISITPSQEFKCDVEVFAIVDGKEKFIKKIKFDRSRMSANVGPIIKGAYVTTLPNIITQEFKLKCTNFRSSKENYGFAEINFSEAPILDKYIEKQLGKMYPSPRPKWNTYMFNTQNKLVSKEGVIQSNEVIDISDKIDSNGNLKWSAPKGSWTILRLGMTPTGTKNLPAAPQAIGYEIDKMNAELVKYHFDNFVGEFLKRIPEDSKSAFKYVIADSYEQGSQNWTDNYQEKFEEKYGYNPIKYLPVLSGRIVGSVEESERFLWDLRRGVADDIAYEYVGALKEKSNENNLKTWLENYGHRGFPSEFMMYGGQSDLVSGEFWNEGSLGNTECKAASSTAHAYGKPIASAEAFTSKGKPFLRHPAMLKKRGDWAITQGINHFVLHVYIHQPDDNRKPGVNAWFGTEFNRQNTWFSQADTYFDYLRRCQHLLQKGKYVADVCYFISEDAPMMTGGRTPEIPDGYSFDYINAEVILNRLTVKDGRFVLPDGMSYKVMVLPPLKTMRPNLLHKLEELVSQGGVILGPKPEKSPSLENYPACDNEVREIANKMWSADYKDGKMKKGYGNGMIWDGYQLSDIFADLNLSKDVDIPENTPLLWTHRKSSEMDIYFLSNQSDEDLEVAPIFRTNKNFKPELWNAVTGEVRKLSNYKITSTGIQVPLKIVGSQSWFVIFNNTKEELKEQKNNFPEYKTLVALEKDFKVDFLNKEIGPKETVLFNDLIDWSTSDNEKIKYYSGTAVYTKTFTVNQDLEDNDVFINLGKLSVMAKVKVNDTYIGGVWMDPYRLNISEAIKKGDNKLEIEVVNLWRNQLIRDMSRPKNEKYTWVTTGRIKPEDAKLETSGLLGPIKIEIAKY